MTGESTYLNPEESGTEDIASTLKNKGEELGKQAKQTTSEMYQKTAQTVSDTYNKAKEYGYANPGKSILMALGIGAGIGFMLGNTCRPSRTGRIARPVVNALSDIAQEYFR